MSYSEQDALLLKQALAGGRQAGGQQAGGQQAGLGAQAVSPAVKIWRSANFANAGAFTTFVNAAPPQGAGEAFAVAVGGGPGLIGFYFL